MAASPRRIADASAIGACSAEVTLCISIALATALGVCGVNAAQYERRDRGDRKPPDTGSWPWHDWLNLARVTQAQPSIPQTDPDAATLLNEGPQCRRWSGLRIWWIDRVMQKDCLGRLISLASLLMVLFVVLGRDQLISILMSDSIDFHD